MFRCVQCVQVCVGVWVERTGVNKYKWKCSGVFKCVQVCLDASRCVQVCPGVPRCVQVCAGVEWDTIAT